jgi:hypothetical protein
MWAMTSASAAVRVVIKAKTLDRDLVLDTNGPAHIAADDLEDMYQGCTEDVVNFDPRDG